MPVHDWTRVDAGLFHAFHQRWISSLCDALNGGGLPRNYFALPEQNIRGPIPDVLTLKLASGGERSGEEDSGGVAVATAPPRTRLTKKTEADTYLTKTSRVTVRHRHGTVVAVIEIVSPGNKGSRGEFRAFVEKSADLILQGIHLLLIDLFPPGPRDPQGIAKAIWDEFSVEDFEQFPDKPLTLASFDAGSMRAVHVEPFAVGDPLSDMPLFLKPETYVHAPLERTYQETWRVFPDAMKKLLD
jgi:hypothetical protein